MALSRVYVLCATAILSIAKIQSAPIGGLLSGLFGGDDGQSRFQNPGDVNQLLRQYYNQQPEDPQLAPYAQYAQQYPQIPQAGQYNPYASIQPSAFQPYQSAPDPYAQFAQQPGFGQGFGDPYGQASPYFRSELGQPGGSQADELPAPSAQHLSYGGDPTSYRALSSGPGDAQSASGVPQSRLDGPQSPVPVASSLVAHRVLQESVASPKSISASNLPNDGNLKDQ